MDPTPASSEKSLEERLREMMLRNVTISDQPTNRHSPQRTPQQHQGYSSPQNQRFSYHGSPPPQRHRQPTTPRAGGAQPETPRQSHQSVSHSPVSAGPYHSNLFQNYPRSGSYHHHHSSSNPILGMFPDDFRRGPLFSGPGSEVIHFQQQQYHRQIYFQQHPVGFLDPVGTFNGINSPYHNQSAQPLQHQQLETFRLQSAYLDQLAAAEIPKIEMSEEEMSMKESFRTHLETLCAMALLENDSTKHLHLALKPFGSISSGFAMQGSDMDLVICLLSESGDPVPSVGHIIPRILEKCLLEKGYGARLLTKTRVPILKICETPTPELYSALSSERKEWEELPENEKYTPSEQLLSPTDQNEMVSRQKPQLNKANKASGDTERSTESVSVKENPLSESKGSENSAVPPPKDLPLGTGTIARPSPEGQKAPNSPKKAWTREKKPGPLDFPRSGVGIQCDINFSTTLGLHNTQLLRCYSLCDPRVKPMVLFVKAWAKCRKINSSYSGTLSSYGYVLMVLHFLANIANPPVVPNLQHAWRPPYWGNDTRDENCYVENYDIRFWKDEREIRLLASQGVLSQNQQSIGELLRNFFQYFAVASVGYTGNGYIPGFLWTQAVISLRTPGGIVRKAAKGWTGANTTVVRGKEVRNRYLFAIEDPFETDHNVARTVTHNGIVAIRDEFRRAWRIICAVGQGTRPEGGLFDVMEEL